MYVHVTLLHVHQCILYAQRSKCSMTQQGNGIAIRHSINSNTNKQQNQTNNVMLCYVILYILSFTHYEVWNNFIIKIY